MPHHLSFLLCPASSSCCFLGSSGPASRRIQPSHPSLFFSREPCVGSVISPPKEPRASARLPLPIPGCPLGLTCNWWSLARYPASSPRHPALPLESELQERHQPGTVLSRKKRALPPPLQEEVLSCLTNVTCVRVLTMKLGSRAGAFATNRHEPVGPGRGFPRDARKAPPFTPTFM